MKTNCWLVLGVMIATSAVAQVNTNSAPVVPTPAVTVPVPPATTIVAPVTTNAPAKKAAVKHKKTAAKKKVAKAATKAKKTAVAKSEVAATPELPVTLLPGDAEVATDHVNVRGQAGVKGEVIAHLKKGDKVTVIAEITLDKHPADEPAQWAKIALPADVKVWVNAKFVDATNKVVSAKKLNVRGGAGENFSVLGVLEQGAPINQVSAKGEWLQIDAPTNAYAFVAASLLKPSATPTEPVATIVTPTPTPTVENTTPVAPAIPAVPTTTNTVADAPPIVTTPVATVTDTNTAAVTPPVTPVADSNAVAAVTPPTNAIPVVASDEETNQPPRIVTHEGIVHNVRSIIAPTYYQLDDQVSGREINYLYTTTTNLDLSHYKGLHVIVTGEESLAARWKDTPLLTIQRIQVVE